MALIYHLELDRYADVNESAVDPHIAVGWTAVDPDTTAGLEAFAALPEQQQQMLRTISDDELRDLITLATPAVEPEAPAPPPDTAPADLPYRPTTLNPED